MSLNSLKWAAILCFVVAMAVLLGGGFAMKKDLPPYPGKVVGPDGKVRFEKSNIIAGQNVYQRYGLMDQGAVWGHGSQRGPEFSAASLKLIADAIGDYSARQDFNKAYGELDDLQKGLVDVKIAHETKTNRYNAATDTLTLTTAQVEGLNRVKEHWGIRADLAQGSTVFTLNACNTVEEIDYVLEKLPAVVDRLRSFSPIWGKEIPQYETDVCT